MPQSVHVIGAGRTDFKRNFRKEGKGLREMIVEAGRAAIADAGIDPSRIKSAVVGNFAAGLFTRQLHLGSFVPDIDDYAVWTLARSQRSADLEWTAQTADDWRKPWADFAGTRYEAKAKAAGRLPCYLSFRRR